MQIQQTDYPKCPLPIPPLLTLPIPTLTPYTHFCTAKQMKHFNMINGDEQQQIDLDDMHNKQLQSKISTTLKQENNHFIHQSEEKDKKEKQKQVNITQYIKCQRCQKWLFHEELDLHMTFHPSQINQRLYLGDRFGSANKKELIERLSITHVVNAATQLPNCFQETQQISYLKLSLEDKMQQDVIQPCLIAAQFIRNFFVIKKDNSLSTKEQHKVFVHCAMGKSRSVAAILVYLMKYHNMGFKQSLEFVKSKRSIAKPNPSYMRQLQQFQFILKEQRQKENI